MGDAIENATRHPNNAATAAWLEDDDDILILWFSLSHDRFVLVVDVAVAVVSIKTSGAVCVLSICAESVPSRSC